MKTNLLSKHINPVVAYYWKKLAVYKSYVIGIAVTMPFNVLMNQIIPPIILAHVLNRLANGDYVSKNLWGSFGFELVAYSALVIFGSLSWRVIDAFQWRLEAKVEQSIAQEVFSKLLSQSARFHADNFSGSMVSNNNKILGGYVRFADTTTFMILPLFLGLVFSMIVLSQAAPWFALVLLIFSITYMTSAIYITRRVRDFGADYASTESKQTGVLADVMTNVMAVKSFAGQKYEESRFARATQKTFVSFVKYGRAHQRQQLYFGTLLSSINAVSLFMAVIAVIFFGSNVATVFLIFTYTGIISEQLFMFSNAAMRNYNRALADARKMVEILKIIPEVLDPINPEKVSFSRGQIEFSDVRFTHNGSKATLFKGLNLQIKQGEKVGLIGHSGSGKTTLTKILLRFSDIDSGEIKIDGQNIANVLQDDLRREIAYVPQEPLLFHRSIAENIAYGDWSATQAAIEAAAKMAYADGFVKDLPKGYDTLVGERGIKLSGGQRQRIAIARAMLKNAPILVLDEATSALDSESEALIQKALWRLMENRTAIVVAHRLSTVQKMDRIIVMEEGTIIEQGTHKELLAKQDGVYAGMWARQSGGFIED